MRQGPFHSHRLVLAGLICLPLVLGGCSIKKMAINGFAGAMSKSAEAYAMDDDPELVRDALPFGLKTIEGLLLEAPDNPDLLLSACSGFTQYAYGFVQLDAEMIEFEDYDRFEELQGRARKLFLRGRDYGLRGLELDYPGIAQELRLDPEAAVARLDEEDLDLLFWTAAGWGSAISLSQSDPDLVADLGTVNAMFRRGLELDPAYANGGIHEVLIGLSMLPLDGGPHPEEARKHFARALSLSQGRSAGTYLSLATSVSIPDQNREEFEGLLKKALTVDPDEFPEGRLQNLLAQKKARFLLENVDEYFY